LTCEIFFLNKRKPIVLKLALNNKGTAMNNRERYLKTMRYESVDHPPMLLPGNPWATTRKRWEQEGLPA
jgi:hypothetical protein